jgi:hypothetical protein
MCISDWRTKVKPPKKWLSEYRDRFEPFWRADCAFETREGAIAYTAVIVNELGDGPKIAQARVRNEETGEVPWERDAKRCSGCTHWRLGYGYGKDYKVEALGHDPWKYEYKGVCNACVDGRAQKTETMSSSGRLWTHEDFLCVLYEERSDDAD